MSKKLMAILAIAVLASMSIPLALAFGIPYTSPTPVIPSQCTTAVTTGAWGTTPIINAKMSVKNDEDPGVVGYWALDDYVENFIIWENPTATGGPTFCALSQYSGIFQTFTGALSPQLGTKEPFGAWGTYSGAAIYTFTGTFLGPYCRPTKTVTCTGSYSTKPLTGYIGKYNFGGTQSDIMLGAYTSKQTGDKTPVDYTNFYFSGSSSISYLAWSRVYTLGSGVGYSMWFNAALGGYGSMWVNSLAGSFGDIVT